MLEVVATGALGLDQRVAEVWPEYAARGKQDTTMRHVLSHAAGLPCFPEAAAGVPFDDLPALCDLLAALTYGHLCDALVRRATGDDLAERFAGIASAHGWDLHLRVPPAADDRVADVVALDGWPGDHLTDPRWGPALGRPAGLLDVTVLNSTRFRRCSFPAVALHASARGLARFYADLTATDGPVAGLLGTDLHAAYVSAQARGHDRVLDREVTWTLGFQLDEDGLGMGGAGGCTAWWSPHGGYAAAYVTRGLGDQSRGEAVWEALGP